MEKDVTDSQLILLGLEFKVTTQSSRLPPLCDGDAFLSEYVYVLAHTWFTQKIRLLKPFNSTKRKKNITRTSSPTFPNLIVYHVEVQ